MLVWPLGFLSYKAAFAVWAVMSIVVIAGCARAVWNLCTPTPSLAPALLSLLFGPTVVILMLGQLTVLVLLGITLFLILAERNRDWLAGASLLLVVAKPHVAFLFLLAVLLWILYFKRWKILVSGAVAFTAATIAAIAINPHIYSQFLDRTRLVVHETESYPNLGGALYAASGHHILALLPQLIGLIWLVFYWRRHRVDWDWKSDGMVVLLVSVATSYYSYPYDEVLVLPALMAAYVTGNRRIFLIGLVATNLGYALYISDIAGHFRLGYMFLVAGECLATHLCLKPAPTDAVATSLLSQGRTGHRAVAITKRLWPIGGHKFAIQNHEPRKSPYRKAAPLRRQNVFLQETKT